MRTNPIDNYFSFFVGDASIPTSSKEYGMLVTGAVYGTPERELENISVPGLNGDVIVDHGRWKNIEVTYHCEIAKNFRENIFAFNNAIGRNMNQYKPLRDSYDTTHYREARFVGATNPEPLAYAESGKVDIVFDCKPQRYLDQQIRIDVTTTTTVRNTTGYEALPIFIVREPGTFTITNEDGTGHTMTILHSWFDTYATMIIDSESKTCGNGSLMNPVNGNSYVSGIFPTLKFGVNTVTVSNGLQMQINPRWWTL